jgi:hypothetical protein
MITMEQAKKYFAIIEEKYIQECNSKNAKS